MKQVQLFVVIVLAFALGACGSVTKDIETQSAIDGRVDIKSYKTFSWFADTAILADDENRFVIPGYDVGAELHHLIGTEMRDLGYNEVVEASPDLMVSYLVLVDMDAIQVVEERSENITTIEELPVGAIYVELIDPQTMKAVWVGLATGEVHQQYTDEQSQKRLDYAVSHMFKSLK